MNSLRILILNGPDEFQWHSAQWDDLWLRSTVTHPTAQAPLIQVWLERFHASQEFRALVVAEGERFVAALPLVTRHKRRVIRCLDVPGNEWSSAGQLLLDPAYDPHVLCERLLDAMGRLDPPAFWFPSIPLGAPGWHQLMRAARRRGWRMNARQRYRVGYLPLGSLAQRWPQSLPAGLRKQLRRAMHRLQAGGPLRLHVSHPADARTARSDVDAAWRLEHTGWKGAAGTSAMSDPDARAYLENQARELIQRRQLVVALLEHDGTPMAFEYGWYAKRTFHSYKVGYDPRFARYSPGQLLLYHLIERFLDSRETDAIDFLGPLDSAVARWHPQTYPMGRLLLAPPGTWGSAMVWAASLVFRSCGEAPRERASREAPLPIA